MIGFQPTTVPIGKRFFRWTIVARLPNRERPQNKHNYPMCLCRCDCGTERAVLLQSLNHSGSKSCGCLNREKLSGRRADLHPMWKGGRNVHPAGYIMLHRPIYPGSNEISKQFEHIVVMARHIGRALLPKETVHHKNGIRHDNRIENLELWTSSHPPGQRVQDLVAWAEDILKTYKLKG